VSGLIGYTPMPRRCTDCGLENPTVLLVIPSGAELCGRCWAETTTTASATQPKTPHLDRHIARVETREARR
jgi:NMD protein affecting ribosome stability and mRNA decay